MSDAWPPPMPPEESASTLPPPVGPPVGAGYPPPPPPPPPVYGYPAAPPASMMYGAPHPYGYPRDHPRAALALGLGIGGIVAGFFTLGLGFALGPFAWYFGQRSRSDIRQAPGAYHSDGNATAGMVLGIIATVFLALAAILWTFLIIGMTVGGSSNGGTNALALISAMTARS